MKIRYNFFLFPILISAPPPPSNLMPRDSHSSTTRYPLLYKRIVNPSFFHNITLIDSAAQFAEARNLIPKTLEGHIPPPQGPHLTTIESPSIHRDAYSKQENLIPCGYHRIRTRRNMRRACIRVAEPLKKTHKTFKYNPPGLSITKNAKDFGINAFGLVKSTGKLAASTVWFGGKAFVFGLVVAGWGIQKAADGLVVVGKKGPVLIWKGTKATVRYTAAGVAWGAKKTWKFTKWGAKKVIKGVQVVAGVSVLVVAGIFNAAFVTLKAFLRMFGYILAKSGSGIATAGTKLQRVSHRFREK